MTEYLSEKTHEYLVGRIMGLEDQIKALCKTLDEAEKKQSYQAGFSDREVYLANELNEAKRRIAEYQKKISIQAEAMRSIQNILNPKSVEGPDGLQGLW